MKQIKDFLNKLVDALGKVLLVITLLMMIGIMTAWTVGMIYVTNQGNCQLEEGRVVCELSKE